MGVSAIQDNLSQTLVSIGLPNEISEIRASNFIKSMPNAQKIVVLEQLSNFQFGITVSKFDPKWMHGIKKLECLVMEIPYGR